MFLYPRLMSARSGKTATCSSKHLLSSITLLEKNDEMPGVRDFLRRAKNRIRNRSEDPSGIGLPATPRPTESAPDLRINTSALPSTSRSPESDGVRAVSSQTTHLEIENTSGVGLSVPRSTESTPDLQIGTSTLSLTTRGPEPNGMYTALLRRSA